MLRRVPSGQMLRPRPYLHPRKRGFIHTFPHPLKAFSLRTLRLCVPQIRVYRCLSVANAVVSFKEQHILKPRYTQLRHIEIRFAA